MLIMLLYISDSGQITTVAHHQESSINISLQQRVIHQLPNMRLQINGELAVNHVVEV